MKNLADENSLFEPLMKPDEAAVYLGFSPLTIKRMAHDGRIPSIAFPMGATGKFTHRFRASDLRAFLATLERRP